MLNFILDFRLKKNKFSLNANVYVMDGEGLKFVSFHLSFALVAESRAVFVTHFFLLRSNIFIYDFFCFHDFLDRLHVASCSDIFQ